MQTVKDDYKTASALAQKVRENLSQCTLCPRKCKVNRLNGEIGFCGLDDKLYCFREMLHRFEETLINPSHQIYLAGCNLKCEFCTVAEWNQKPRLAARVNLEQIAPKIEQRKKEGAKSLNFLGGEPVLSLHGIFEIIARLNSAATIVLNSNMYFSEEIFTLTKGLVDFYLADFKCGNNTCAKNLLQADNYFEIVTDNISAAARQTDIIVRHLILPGHFDCCTKPVLDWLKKNNPEIKLSLRRDYVPPPKPDAAPENYLNNNDFKRTVSYARNLHLNMI